MVSEKNIAYIVFVVFVVAIVVLGVWYRRHRLRAIAARQAAEREEYEQFALAMQRDRADNVPLHPRAAHVFEAQSAKHEFLPPYQPPPSWIPGPAEPPPAYQGAAALGDRNALDPQPYPVRRLNTDQ
ncbi:hypothetical protein IWW55_001635 [Coemansia sp. RSA 2706]